MVFGDKLHCWVLRTQMMRHVKCVLCCLYCGLSSHPPLAVCKSLEWLRARRVFVLSGKSLSAPAKMRKKKHEENVISFTWMIKITLPPQQKYTSYRTSHLILKKKQANKKPPHVSQSRSGTPCCDTNETICISGAETWLKCDDCRLMTRRKRSGGGHGQWWKKAGNQT